MMAVLLVAVLSYILCGSCTTAHMRGWPSHAVCFDERIITLDTAWLSSMQTRGLYNYMFLCVVSRQPPPVRTSARNRCSSLKTAPLRGRRRPRLRVPLRQRLHRVSGTGVGVLCRYVWVGVWVCVRVFVFVSCGARYIYKMCQFDIKFSSRAAQTESDILRLSGVNVLGCGGTMGCITNS